MVHQETTATTAERDLHAVGNVITDLPRPGLRRPKALLILPSRNVASRVGVGFPGASGEPGNESLREPRGTSVALSELDA